MFGQHSFSLPAGRGLCTNHYSHVHGVLHTGFHRFHQIKQSLINKTYVVVRLAKYNVYRYIGCIIDQSNWSRSFSLVVKTPD